MSAIYGREAICAALDVKDWRSVERRMAQGLPVRKEPGGSRWVLLVDDLERWLRGDGPAHGPGESLSNDTGDMRQS